AAKTFSWMTLSAATDVDGDTITAGVQVQGTKWAFVIAGDNITYTPAAGQAGSDICTIRIADGQWHTIDRTITVNNIDTIAPTLTNLPNFWGSVASGATIPKTISMQDNNALFTGSSMVSITTTYGSITGFDSSDYGDNKPFNYVAPVNNTGEPQPASITYTIRDAAGNQTTFTDNFLVEVAVANNAPTGPALADVSRGDNAWFVAIAPINTSTGVTDADGGDVLTYSAVGLPVELSIDPSTGIITGTIDVLWPTVYPVTVTVNDGNGGTLVRSFNLTVTNEG
ncbi:MAG: hemolysin-type calcium-binding repeat family protein 3, partial [uncultured bacterium (gcode 4)]